MKKGQSQGKPEDNALEKAMGCNPTTVFVVGNLFARSWLLLKMFIMVRGMEDTSTAPKKKGAKNRKPLVKNPEMKETKTTPM